MTSILDLYKQDKSSILDKSIRQILSFTGDGILRNENETAKEFRELLSVIPTDYLIQYAHECLDSGFTDSGFVLQDIINQAGKRLGFDIEYGLYQGSKNTIGYDGIWQLDGENEIIIEVKTTDAYRINLESIYGYKQKLVEQKMISEKSSILIVVGRKDTGDLEAQIRGSRYGWDFRLVSVESLMKLVKIKEDLNDEKTIKQISDILRPLEFTRLDKLIEIVFETTQDIQSEDIQSEELEKFQPEFLPDNEKDALDNNKKDKKTRSSPVNFQDQCLHKIEAKFDISLLKITRTCYKTVDSKYGFHCCISKKHVAKSYAKYWFAFHQRQEVFLEKFKDAYLMFGCGSEHDIFLIPYDIFQSYKDCLWTTEKDNKIYWHIVIQEKNKNFFWQIPQGNDNVDLEQYRI